MATTYGDFTWDGKDWVQISSNASGRKVSTSLGVTPGTFDETGKYVPLAMGTGKNAATDTTARILRGNYANWKETYFPVLQDMLSETTYANPGLVGEETAKATNQVTGAYTAARTGMQDTMARYGLSVDPSTEASTNLAEVAAKVGAQNETRQYLTDRDRSIMTGMPSPVSSSS